MQQITVKLLHYYSNFVLVLWNHNNFYLENLKNSNNDSNVISTEGNSNITVGHEGRSICTPTTMGLNLRHNFGL